MEISTLRSEEPLPEGDFDAAHYCSVHRHLFQDVYERSGLYRTVRTSKGGNAFCYPENIPAQMESLFQELRDGDVFRNQEWDRFLSEIVKFLSELNAIHPFREGNGRAQLAFLGLVGATVDRPFDFPRLNRATFMPAMVASFDGNRQPLLIELDKLLA